MPETIENLQTEIAILKQALREALVTKQRATSRCVDYDPAGSTYEIDWTEEVRRWAALCDLDLDTLDPGYYCRN